MALINLHTNLKSLRFGNDIQGGGSSGLPYIQPGLPEDSPAGEYLAGIARNSADWPLRGGTYSTIASTEDSVRISRFLTDFPKGSIFTAKQVGLQKSNPNIETGGKASRLNTQTYNLNANLLAQVFEQGTGIHIPRAGANTNELNDYHNKYEYTVASRTNSNDNRLVTLFNSKIEKDSLDPNLDLNLIKLGISKDDNTLFNYTMGPDSLYGDGNTIIFKATDSKGVPIKTSTSFENFEKGPFYNTLYSPGFNFFSKTDSKSINNRYSSLTKYIQNSKIPELSDNFNSIVVVGAPNRNTLIQQSSPSFIRPEITPDSDPYTYPGDIHYFGNTMGYSKLLESKTNSGPGYDLQDFRAQTNASTLASTVSYTTGGPNEKGFNIESRIGVGSPGTRPNNLRNSFYDEYKDGQDKINMSPIYRRNITDPVEDDSPEVRDLIKFCIESIDNGYPDKTNRMHFRAYITNFSDNIGAEWNAQRYMGRGENFYTYQGFTREVGFTFIVAAQSVQEMEKIYQKVNYLASTLLPDYSGQGFMRGTIHKLTIGEYFYRTSGVITSMNISVEDNYPWEIKMSQPELRNKNNGDDNASGDQLQMEVPQILKIQMSFKPIMDKLPQKGLKEPIIISEKVANNYLSRKDFKFSN